MKLTLLHSYFGPNRRSDSTLVEAMLHHETAEESTVAESWDDALPVISAELEPLGAEYAHDATASAHPSAGPMAGFAELLNAIALTLQRAAGSQVDEHGYLVEPGKNRLTTWFEHDEASVGRQAAVLALKLLDQAFPGLDVQCAEYGKSGTFAELLDSFMQKARRMAQSPDATAIIQAARRQGVPVIRLERDPYTPVEGDFRIRMNSMLMLGHCAHRQIVDGTFALEASEKCHPLLSRRQAAMRAAVAMQLPVPPSYREHQTVVSKSRAARAARELGFPLVVKTVTGRQSNGTTINIRNEEELAAAVERATAVEPQFYLERHIPGHTWKLLVAGHELITLVSGVGIEEQPSMVHPETASMAERAARQLNAGMLVLTLVARDISAEPADQAIVVGLDLAPRLDELLSPDSEAIAKAADAFVRWLVPAGANSQLPVAAVTGTSGKTTTSRMLAGILQQSGLVTGLQCTDGRYVNGEQVFAGDDSALTGHFAFYESPMIQAAVLESHHRGIGTTGFAFDHCEVAICTNVSGEHLGVPDTDQLDIGDLEIRHLDARNLGLETVDDIGVLKRALLERARGTAVLNADNAVCMKMIPHLHAERICLVSLEKTASELAPLTEKALFCVVSESREGRDWIVVHEDDKETPIIAIEDIPAAFGGAARFNVMNAMQAIAGGYAMGVDPAGIKRAMSAFEMSTEKTPGRMNFIEGLPYRVLVDFAHNPDGFRRISEFADGFEVDGSKTIAFSCSPLNPDSHNREMCAEIAGHFDRYVLKSYGIPESMDLSWVPEEINIDDVMMKLLLDMKTALIDSGVADEQISVTPGEFEGIELALDGADPGDLVVLLLGYDGMEKIGGFMQEYIARTAGE